MTDKPPRVSVIIPAYQEGSTIIPVLERLLESITLPHEILIIVDLPDDSTIPFAAQYAPQVRVLLNDYGRGPANAIRYGFDHASAPVVVVTMADGCDDPRQIDELTRLVERGVVVAAASRFMPGGMQVGGLLLKRTLSRLAGRSLYWFARVGTRDATNSFKAYDHAFVDRVGIDSRDGFEIGIELTAKARRLRLPVAELPTVWLDRTEGESNFKLGKWLPKYLHWYWHAFGPSLAPPSSRKSKAKVKSAAALSETKDTRQSGVAK
jgi:glycosyltransferase involved in cell wall biosynthesis